ENIQTYQAWFLQDPVTLRNIGIIMGAMLSALLASQFRIKKIKSKKQIIGAAVGGLLMGYGSSIASGCNIGAFYSGIASMSLSGWIFGVFLFVGAFMGGKLLIRFFM
ncbi:MAG: YeeE/YedE family protein, partial [Eubacteriaceae bacterium]|nr:YeeE/YedE family protein [Eubacteriaceae bacterium]